MARRRPVLSVLVWASFAVLLALGACFLDAPVLECFACPCGTSDYVCEQGLCIHKQVKTTYTPAQLSDYIQKKCYGQGLGEGGTDVSPGCQCPAGYTCDPATKKCIPPGKTCPDGSQPLPDGSCPTTRLCDGVQCPDQTVCNESTGRCEKVTCVTQPSLCPAPRCCRKDTASCVSDCRTCESCPAGTTCNQNTGECGKGTPTCTPQLACSIASDCCGRRCIQHEVSSGSRRWLHSSCYCNSNFDCPGGLICAPIQLGSQIVRICSCRNADDCGGELCRRGQAGVGICARRVQ